MKSAAPRGVPLALLNQVARRSVEWLIMAEDLPTPDSRVTVDGAGGSPPRASSGGRARIASCSSG
jgi:hypothetical protein